MRAGGLFAFAALTGMLLAGCADIPMEAISSGPAAAPETKCSVPRLAAAAGASGTQSAGEAADTRPAKTGPAETEQQADLLTPAEAQAAYDCIAPKMRYAASGHRLVALYRHWQRRDAAPIRSEPHSGRYVAVFANTVAAEPDLRPSEKSVPVGAVLATPSFSVRKNGTVDAGHLVLIEKMEKGFNSSGGNWRYTVIDPAGGFVGVTNGWKSHALPFCRDCTVSSAAAIYTALLNGEAPPKPNQQFLDPTAISPPAPGAAIIPPGSDPMASPVPSAAPAGKAQVLDPKQNTDPFKDIPGSSAPAESGGPAAPAGGQDVLDPMLPPR